MIPSQNILRRMEPQDRKGMGKAGLLDSECAEIAAVKSERDLQKLIANELLRRGIWFSRSAMNRKTTNTVGTPDFLFCCRGFFCAVEVKHGAGKVRPEQQEALDAILENDGRCMVVRSFEGLLAFLKGVEA